MQPIQFFVDYKIVFIIIHVLAVIIGMGSALIADIMFNVFINDKKLEITENRVLSILSKIVWFGLALMIVSGIFIFFSNPERYLHSAKFLTKMFVVLCLTINGLMFQYIVHPALRKINFTDTNSHHYYVRVRRFSFAFGAVSVVSWLIAFVLGMLKKIPLTLPQAILIYLVILVVAVIGSQIIERLVIHKK